MTRPRKKRRVHGAPRRGPGMHAHEHRHDEAAPHAHPHHHHAHTTPVAHTREAAPLVHDHGHGRSFERHTWICSPVHDLDPRAKIVVAAAIVLTVVLSGPPRPAELVAIAAFLLAVTAIARVPLGAVLARSALVLPFAGTIALFAPLQQTGGSLSVGGLAGAYGDGGWLAAYAILAKAWLATLTAVVLSTTTPVPRLFRGLEALKVPDVIMMLLAFMYRYVDVIRDQLGSLKNALDSRGFALTRVQRVRLMGNLAGNLFIRAYDRGERVHAAMLSRGWTGGLPSTDTLAFTGSDLLAVVLGGLFLLAVVLY